MERRGRRMRNRIREKRDGQEKQRVKGSGRKKAKKEKVTVKLKIKKANQEDKKSMTWCEYEKDKIMDREGIKE